MSIGWALVIDKAARLTLRCNEKLQGLVDALQSELDPTEYLDDLGG